MSSLDSFLLGFVMGCIIIASLWALADYKPPKLEKKKKK